MKYLSTVYMVAVSVKKKQRKDDRNAVRRIRRGEKQEFQELFGRYQKKLALYIHHLVGQREDTEDILQIVFIKAYEKFATFDGRRQFSSWIYRIAHNESVNVLRRRSRRKFVSWEDIVSAKDKAEVVHPDRSPFDRYARKDIRDEVRAALNSIPKKYKEVLVLRFYLDKSYDEIGEIIGKPKNTVGTLIMRAKRRMLRVLNESKGF